MKRHLHRIVSALQSAIDPEGVWIGQVAPGGIRAVSVPLENALSTHFNLGMFAEKRWRYRNRIVFWWAFSDVTEQDKRAVERWLSQHGLDVHQHIANSQRIEINGERMWAFQYSHGGGPNSKRRTAVKVLEK